jgi:hypothetical protein
MNIKRSAGRAAGSTAILAALLIAAPTRASISLTQGNNPQPDEQSVILNPGTGSSVTGHTDSSNTTVKFTSVVDQLLVNSSGQATIQGAGNSGINQITITVPGFTFTDLIFNPAGNGSGPFTAGAPVTLGVLANESGGTASLHLTSTPAYTIGSGNNYASIMATGGESMMSVTISLFMGSVFSDLQQVHIGGLEPANTGNSSKTNKPDAPAIIPEPSAIFVWLFLALPAAAFWHRHRRRSRVSN